MIGFLLPFYELFYEMISSPLRLAAAYMLCHACLADVTLYF